MNLKYNTKAIYSFKLKIFLLNVSKMWHTDTAKGFLFSSVWTKCEHIFLTGWKMCAISII